MRLATKAGERLEFVGFVPVGVSDKIKPGQKVRIVPSAIDREEVGTMLATVRYVDNNAASPEALRALLQSDDVVRLFTSQGPVVIAYFDLVEDQNTVSGYAWTSSRGDEVPVADNNSGTADVEVRFDRPIGLLIPTLRRWSGI
jgi:HlyD family secretion protein